MKAIRYDKYGSYDLLSLREIDKPAPKDGEVLVRVRAASLHVGDCFSVKGSPFMVRAVTGITKPKTGIPGWDVAGEVETVGAGVTQFKPGDEVFGGAQGTCAEYVCVKEKELAPKPTNLTFEEAASLVTSGIAALKAVRDVARVQAGQKVLINGASGGVGHFEVQMAKSYGAEVTGVCSGRNAEMVRSLGADHVVDYTQEDFTRGEQRYDVIFDNIENRSLADVRRVLSQRGTLVLNSGRGAAGLAMVAKMVTPLLLSPFSKQSLKRYMAPPNQADLIAMKEMAEAGTLRPVMDRTYPLEETAAALAYIDEGHVPGKVAVTVA
jgi:NADPH:quinone reductase-like Zn-dependent oxidoreductase